MTSKQPAWIFVTVMACWLAGTRGGDDTLMADSAWLQEKREILRHMTIVELDDGQGGTVKTIRISGANLQIVSGLNATNGLPGEADSIDLDLTVTNGLGNLIVGYGEGVDGETPTRTGSHNIVGGIGASYSSFGGMVLGRSCESTGPYGCVVSGNNNQAQGAYSAVLGGGGVGFGTSQGNVAQGEWSTVVGGGNNMAEGQGASVVGGSQNRALASEDVIVGGFLNVASASQGVVCGGRENLADGPHSVVCGGSGNTAKGFNSVVSGGSQREAANSNDWVAGSLFEAN